MAVDLATLSAQIQGVFGMKPFGQEVEGVDIAVRALFQPSFDPECGLTLLIQNEKSSLSVHSAKQSIWAYLNAKDGVPGYALVDRWVEPAIANEVLELSAEDCKGLTDQVSAVATWVHKRSGFGIDGMPVRLEIAGRKIEPRVFELWFSQDAATPPGTLAKHLYEVALAKCQWELTKATLIALRRYG